MGFGLNTSFRLQNTELLGLDIGSSHIKLIKLIKKSSRYDVAAAEMVEIPADENSDTTSEKSTIKALQRCIKKTGVSTRQAVCGVCGPEVAVRYFEFPPLSSGEIEGAVLLEAGQVCPFNIEESSVDYQLIQNGDKSARGVLVAATNNLIETKTRFANRASIKCVLMDVDSLALLNCFEGFGSGDGTEDAQSIAILHLGNTYTTVAVKGTEGLPYTRDLPIGSNEIVNIIAKEKDSSPERIRRILTGSISESEAGMEIGESLSKACRNLIRDVNETLRYFETQQKSNFVKKIYVCGGFALVHGMVEILNNQLSASAVLWNPFAKLCEKGKKSFHSLLAKKGPAFTVAAGLAMRKI